MKQIGTLSNGNLIVETRPAEWLYIIVCTARVPRDLPTICRDYRSKHRLSQTALARQVGISRNWMSRIEKGTANISLALYRKLMTVVFKDEEVALEK